MLAMYAAYIYQTVRHG